MTEKKFPGGVWPVMLTPFTRDNQIDREALERLVEWYIEKGVSGLFAVCQSSEMFFLSLAERVQIARAVVRAAKGRVPVIASGHIADGVDGQAEELCAVAETGVDAVILVTNRLAAPEESDAIWIERLTALLARIDPNIPLGFYECPYPYKRLLSPEMIRCLIDTGRFRFLKDTSCNLEQIRQKLKLTAGSELKLYNANSATLLESLREGAAGFSGVMANFHPELYVWLCQNVRDDKAEALQELLTLSALIERQVYPINAKYALQCEGIPMETWARSKDEALLDEVARSEVRQLMRLSGRAGRWLAAREG